MDRAMRSGFQAPHTILYKARTNLDLLQLAPSLLLEKYVSPFTLFWLYIVAYPFDSFPLTSS